MGRGDGLFFLGISRGLSGIRLAFQGGTMEILTELLIGVGYGLLAAVPMMLTFSWASQALGAIPQPYPVQVRRQSEWSPRREPMRLPRAS